MIDDYKLRQEVREEAIIWATDSRVSATAEELAGEYVD